MTASTKPDQLLVRFREHDTTTGVSRKTLARLAKVLGVSENQVMQYALKKLAKDLLPAYEPDEGELTPETLTAIKARVPQGRGKTAKSDLFGS